MRQRVTKIACGHFGWVRIIFWEGKHGLGVGWGGERKEGNGNRLQCIVCLAGVGFALKRKNTGFLRVFHIFCLTVRVRFSLFCGDNTPPGKRKIGKSWSSESDISSLPDIQVAAVRLVFGVHPNATYELKAASDAYAPLVGQDVSDAAESCPGPLDSKKDEIK